MVAKKLLHKKIKKSKSKKIIKKKLIKKRIIRKSKPKIMHVKLINTAKPRANISNKIKKLIEEKTKDIYPLTKPIVPEMSLSNQGYQQFTQRVGIGEAEKRLESKINTREEKKEKDEAKRAREKAEEEERKIRERLENARDLTNEKINTLRDNINEIRASNNLTLNDLIKLGFDVNKLKGLSHAMINQIQHLQQLQESKRFPTLIYGKEEGKEEEEEEEEEEEKAIEREEPLSKKKKEKEKS